MFSGKLMSVVSPHTPLLPFTGDVLPESRYGVYARRWWLLFILSLVSMNQTLVWMTWSPAVDQVQQLYGWSNATIDLLAAWGPIVYIVFAFCTPALVEAIGLRATITVAAVLTLLGSCIRCFTTQAPYAAILAHFGHILNAFSGPLVAATPSKLSAEWFPPRERATATSVAVIGADIGSAVGFLVALPVTLPSRIKYMLWGEAGLSALIVSMCALDHALCSATPPLPPSASALSKRDVRVLKDFWQLLRMPQFMIITLAYSLSLGTFSAWSGVLDPILSPLNFSQTTVNWLGFISTVGSIIGGVAFGNLGDRLSVLKPVIVYTLGISCVFIGWFALIANHTLPRSIWQLFFSCTVGSFTMNAGGGLFYEAAAQLTFPMDEVISASFITLVFNAVGAVYTLLGSSISAAAMNWILAGSFGLCAVGMLAFKEDNRRLKVDLEHALVPVVGIFDASD